MYIWFVIFTLFITSNSLAQEWQEGTLNHVNESYRETIAEMMERNQADSLFPYTTLFLTHPETDPVYQPQDSFNDEYSPLKKATTLAFTAITYPESGFVPPDSMGAVGPTQFIAIVNGRIKSFSKLTGSPDGIINATTNTFFSSVLTPGTFAGDPRIRYDRFSQRWFIVMADFSSESPGNNKIMLAVSTTSSLTSNTQWRFFSFFPASLQPPSNIPNYFADFPTLGIDKFALYIGINVFNGTTQRYVTSEGFVINKQSLLSNGPMSLTAFRTLVNPATFVGPYTPQGVDNFDTDATEGYFIGVDGKSFSKLQLLRVLNPGSTPSISQNLTIPIPVTAQPIPVPHKGNNAGTNGYLDALDTRLGNAHVRKGMLYTVHNIGVNNLGYSVSPITRDGSRWYQISDITATPHLSQYGTLFTRSATNDLNQKFYWMPSVMTNTLNSLIVGTSTAGTNEFINGAYAYRLFSDPYGTLSNPILISNSITPYNLNQGIRSTRRWGDYSNTVVDPADDMTFWTIQEYCASTNIWGVRVARITAAPPPSIAALSTTQLSNNNVSTPLVIFASQETEKAFAAGDEVTNTLKVEITGGVEVISYDFIDAYEIALQVSTFYADAGPVNITVTNPDGQTTTLEGILEVVGEPNKVVTDEILEMPDGV